MMANRKSQAATEMIIILAAALAVLLVIITINNDFMTSSTGQIGSSKARQSLDDLANAAELVYQQGSRARTKVFVTIPAEVQSASAAQKTLSMRLYAGGRLTDVYRTLDFDVAGSIPTGEGNYWVTVEAKEGYVMLMSAIAVISPAGFTKSMNPGGSASGSISIQNTADETLAVSVAYSGSAGISVSFDQASFTLDKNGTGIVMASISAPSSTVPGTYSGDILVSAAGQTSGDTQNNTIGLTVNVAALAAETSNISLYPSSWDAGALAAGITSRLFTACNNAAAARNISMNLSGTGYDYTGFDPALTVNSRVLATPADECNTTYIYINTTGANLSSNGNYTSIVNASAGSYDNSTITFTISIPPQADSLVINTTEAYVGGGGNKRVKGMTVQNIGSDDIILTETNVSWAEDNGEKTETIKISGSNRWKHNCNWGCSPAGTQDSGILLDFGSRDYTLQAGKTKSINEIKFDSNVESRNFTIIFTLEDGSTKSSGSFSP